MSNWSKYKESNNQYKNKKRMLAEDLPIISKRKNKKKIKRSDHKHDYIPAIYYSYYIDFKSNKRSRINYGFHCRICGRIQEFFYVWSSDLIRLEHFKKENPNYIEIILPENWDIFKNKKILI